MFLTCSNSESESFWPSSLSLLFCSRIFLKLAHKSCSVFSSGRYVHCESSHVSCSISLFSIFSSSSANFFPFLRIVPVLRKLCLPGIAPAENRACYKPRLPQAAYFCKLCLSCRFCVSNNFFVTFQDNIFRTVSQLLCFL